MEIWIIILLVFVILGLVVYLVLSKKSIKSQRVEEEHRMLEVQSLFQKNLLEFQNAMLTSVKNDLLHLGDRSAKQMYNISKDVSEQIHMGNVGVSQAFEKFMEQLGKVSQSQQQLKELSMSIAHLENVLTDKKSRGIFGEVELYHLLEMSMGDAGVYYEKQYKLSNGSIVDAVLFTSAPLYKICIDAKFPLENYNRIMDETISKTEREQRHHEFEKDVKKHIKAIHDKYIIPQESAQFAYMFLPAEAIFSYIHANCESVVQYSYEQHVYLVSPATLMAYISAMKSIYLGVKRNEHVEKMQEELKKLHIEFARFEKRYEDLAKDFNKIEQDFTQISITAKKLITRFKEIESVEFKKGAVTK